MRDGKRGPKRPPSPYERTPLAKGVKYTFIGFNLVMLLVFTTFRGRFEADMPEVRNLSGAFDKGGHVFLGILEFGMLGAFWLLGGLALGVATLATRPDRPPPDRP